MQMFQKGRSMIEMLGVLAIIAVLSIGGLLGYRRAVNNHQANVILDDVNRFAFVILERSGLALGEDIPKGDFVESGPYTLKGHQAAGAGQFSILVANVPKSVCEPLVDKGIVEYEVGVATPGGDVDDEVIYDTLHTDLCQEMNDVAFYFGDTSGVCNAPEGNTPTPCTVNSDCCGGEFCSFENPVTNSDSGEGKCRFVNNFDFETKTVTVNGIESTWVRVRYNNEWQRLNWWSAQNWCLAKGLKPATRADLGCGHVSYRYCTTKTGNGGTSADLGYEGSILRALQLAGWSADQSSAWSFYWMEDLDEDFAWTIDFATSRTGAPGKKDGYWTLCH